MVENYWAIIHRYNLLVNEQKARPLACPDCGNEFVTMLGNDDGIILYCAFDDVRTQPGLTFFDDLKAVVGEHYV